MAITLANYYEQYADGNTTGLYSQPGGYTIPNPNNANNNNYTSPGSTLGNNPTPFIINPISSELVEASIAQPMSRDSLGGLQIAGGIDTSRINKFLETPQGTIFVNKQVGLQKMNPKVPFIGPKNNTRVFDIDNLIDQIGQEAIDRHIERHGSPAARLEYPNNPGVYSQFYGRNVLEAGGSLVSGFSGTAGAEQLFNSSLINLYRKMSPGNAVNDVLGIFGASGVLTEATQLLGSANAALALGVGSNWYRYEGGPKSNFGIGETSHKRWTITNGDPLGQRGVAPNPLVSLIPALNDLFPDLPTISSTAIRGLPGTLQNLNREGLSLDARAGIGEVASRTSIAQGSLFGFSPLANRRDLTKSNPKSIDRINNISLLKGQGSNKLGEITNALVNINGNNVNPNDLPKDLVKFRFEAINNDIIGESIFIIFRAFLSNISDRFGATWSDNQYVGRGEKFFIYNGFTRDISFNFSIAAQTRDEVKPLIQKLNFLSSNLAPDYNTAGRMRGPFMKLTIGDYFVSLPGFISSLTYTIRDDSPWDIALYEDLNNNFGINERELPHMIDVSVAYTPIHDFLPKKGTNDVFYMLGVGDEWITELPPMDSFVNPPEDIDEEEDISLTNREIRRAERRINNSPENFRPYDGPSF